MVVESTSQQAAMIVYVGNIVHALAPGRLELLVDHALGVCSGKILFLKPQSEVPTKSSAAEQIVRLAPTQFLFPGFIDTHAHAPQYPNAGIFGDSTLLDWLQRYTFPLEAKFADVEVARAVYERLVARQLRCGTTCTSYFGTIHVPATVELAKQCLAQGMRAQIGRVCMERHCPPELVDATLESDVECVDAVAALDPSGARVWPCVTPRFAPSCEAATLRALGSLARERKLPVQTHINENRDEIAWVAELFPEASSYTDVYDRYGLLKHDTVLAHGVHFTTPELQVVKARGCGISHCPDSNASIASGIAPIKQFLDSGIKVGLGSDISGGSTVSVLQNARLALLLSRLLSERQAAARRGSAASISGAHVSGGPASAVLSVADALFLATLGGAQLLARDDELGSFAPGKAFDAQLVDLAAADSPIDLFELALPSNPRLRLDNLVSKWVYVGDDRNTVKVWVNGELVHERK